VSVFPEIFGGMVGKSNAKRGAERLVWIFQNKKLNQQLLYMLVDEFVASLFVEFKKL
jgi:sorting nexin-25